MFPTFTTIRTWGPTLAHQPGSHHRQEILSILGIILASVAMSLFQIYNFSLQPSLVSAYLLFLKIFIFVIDTILKSRLIFLCRNYPNLPLDSQDSWKCISHFI